MVCPDNMVSEISKMIHEDGMSERKACKKYAKNWNEINKDKGLSVGFNKVYSAYRRAAGTLKDKPKRKDEDCIKIYDVVDPNKAVVEIKRIIDENGMSIRTACKYFVEWFIEQYPDAKPPTEEQVRSFYHRRVFDKEIIGTISERGDGFRSVYVIQSGNTNYYKIGVSVDPYSRMKDLQIGNPVDLKIIASYKVKDAEKIEHELHTVFKNKRLKREWFELNKRDLEVCNSIVPFIEKVYMLDV
jgi:hypothetical protein